LTPSRLSRLLEELAAGPDLARAATAAGYASVAEAAEALRSLDRKPKPTKPKSDPAQALPGPCPDRSPFPKGSRAIAHSDGASRGNPGPAAYGCVYSTEKGTVLCAEGATIGNATNNVAEYRGAIAALKRLRDWGVERITLRLDSQLVAYQLDGSYRVKSEGLKALHTEAVGLLGSFTSVRIEYLPRKQNALADQLANLALDGGLEG
jgi:ribonuclease HI